MFVVVKEGLYWVGGGWSNSPQHAFVFSRMDLAREIAKLVGGRVGETTGMGQ